jgi:cell division septal protein FtsQ
MLQKKLFRRFLSLILFFLLLFTFLITLKYSYELFSVKKIVIIGPKKNFNLKLHTLSEMPIFFINENNEEKKLLNNNPYLKSIKIDKQLPSTLIIYPEYYQPEAQLKINQGYLLLSEDGRILEKTKVKYDNLLTINFYQKLNSQEVNIGDFITFKELKLSLQLIPIFKRLNIKINSIDIFGLNVIVFNLDNNQVFFSGEKDSKKTEYELTRILKKIKLEHQNFKKLDLRFNKPIIIF